MGIDKVLLVPTHAFTDRTTQHANVIAAAQARLHDRATAGHRARRLHRQDPAGLRPADRDPRPYLENLPFSIGADVFQSGVRVPAGDGKVAAATRHDLAEAQAVVLTEPGHAGKTYALHGAPAVSFAEVAESLRDHPAH